MRRRTTAVAVVAASLLTTTGLAAAPVLAGDDCDVPLSQWQSRDAVMRKAVQQGWQVQRLKIDDGCYEIRGSDAEGRSFKAKIDPQTLTIVKLQQQGQRERKRLRDQEQLYLQSLENELNIARKIQQDFLPPEIPEVNGWEIAAYFKAAKFVAGDYYDAFTLPDGNLVFLVGDVCGKGIGAANLFRENAVPVSTRYHP